ncbi:tyrosine-type recombinase/integrase [Marinifilum sp. D737]|uniref:tyrosine-type recombinase/integrase n=1 Tax=Marinifilum sp. D737 TaxID=2969628 RepID=UPI002274F360|nr:tyrosine-type recombinase/integrase [Marinifilum sp. D737]MCY1635906.1 tyrosine-type recombinase/integrase [Marinifilum sp. D737]
MDIQGDISKSEHIEWKFIPLTIQKLELNKQYKIALIVAFGCFFGLRLKNILTIRWEDVLNKTSFEIMDKNKLRTIYIIDDINNLIRRIYYKMDTPDIEQPIFLNNSGKQVLSSQYVNKQIKLLFTKYEIPYQNLSSDSFLKTFCMKFLQAKNFSTDAKRWISQLLGHASWTITANFLGCSNSSEDKDNYMIFSM